MGLNRRFPKATKLRSLNINGTFLLSKPVHYGNLTSLDICLENFDTCQNSGPITDQTLDYLISGNTPELEVLIIDVECEDSDRKYTLSNDFLSGKKLPNIQRLELCGKFTDQSIERIEGGFYKDKLQASFHTEDMHA